nr:immunoglobulin light chain junction region [Macaca mulatta]MOW56402.1 immunoglobulin light chain junction region [Macaca mulatta]MOW56416.1 immunoglobulin light chain junction region [Macaca mulatta]MOW56473.1 immunoglobulin light chain junction region [Macaca mulatta]MOW56671.1 immunoglobulin light chain junction region [Macaca mulatta]
EYYCETWDNSLNGPLL